MIVVKVGGSLFDHPQLAPRLRAYLDALPTDEVMLVPGGGDVVEAVRKLDAIHGLGEEVSHWLALRAMAVTAAVLRMLAEDPTPQPPPRNGEGGQDKPPPSLAGKGAGGLGLARVLDCLAFALDDESRPGKLPHSWDVTSDSIAARAAVVYEAERLVLLKSVDVPAGTPWGVAAERGWVDRYFPTVVAGAAFPVEVVNFRRVLDSALRG